MEGLQSDGGSGGAAAHDNDATSKSAPKAPKSANNPKTSGPKGSGSKGKTPNKPANQQDIAKKKRSNNQGNKGGAGKQQQQQQQQQQEGAQNKSIGKNQNTRETPSQLSIQVGRRRFG